MRPEETIEESIFSIMRKMDKNTKLIVPIEQWLMARTIARDLKKDFGVEFKVRRMMTPRTKLKLVLIERVD